MDIKQLIGRALGKDEDFKVAEKQMKIQKILNERQKNSNERELERYYEEARQNKIKDELHKIRKQRQHEMMVGTLSDKTNIFKGHKSILHSDSNEFKSNKKKVGYKK